jgi:excisionase family DNA binding protein
MPDASRWGTVKDAAEILGVHEMTIRRYINAGDLPARRKGVKLIEVDLDAVRRLMSPIEPTVTRTGVYAGNGVAQ